MGLLGKGRGTSIKGSIIQLTEWGKKTELHETIIHGVHVSIPYERWCNNEVVRIKRADPSRTVKVKPNATGKKCALFGDDRGSHPKNEYWRGNGKRSYVSNMRGK